MKLMFAIQRKHVLCIPILISFGLFVFFSHQQLTGNDSNGTSSYPKHAFSSKPDVINTDTEDYLGKDSYQTSNFSSEVTDTNLEVGYKTSTKSSEVYHNAILNKQYPTGAKQTESSLPEMDKNDIKEDYTRLRTHAASKYNLTSVPSMKVNISFLETVKISKNAVKLCPESPFQSNVEIDFPTVTGCPPRIPSIIHQIFTDEYVPVMFKPHIKSFIENNPSWQYRFWTYESGRQLLKKFHPYLVKTYTDFGNSVRKSDLLRYAVLYEYGGVYVDLDTDDLRPLDRVTIKYACIVPTAPFEHSILKVQKPFYLIGCVMICRPKHPFLKQLLWNLTNTPATGDISNSTGSLYLTHQYMKYNRISEADTMKTKTDLSSNSPYFFKGQMKEDDENAVYVPNSQYFMDKLNPKYLTQEGFITKVCKDISILPHLSKCACIELARRQQIRENRKYAFTVHHFYFLWGKSKDFIGDLKKTHIRKIVPNCILYDG